MTVLTGVVNSHGTLNLPIDYQRQLPMVNDGFWCTSRGECIFRYPPIPYTPSMGLRRFSLVIKQQRLGTLLRSLKKGVRTPQMADSGLTQEARRRDSWSGQASP